MANLTIGYSGGSASANPPNLRIQKNETIDVTVTGDCSVCFDNDKIFKISPPHKKGKRPWTPEKDAEGDAGYNIYAYNKDCKKVALSTYSIHVGS
jgi:hypothetical protein